MVKNRRHIKKNQNNNDNFLIEAMLSVFGLFFGYLEYFLNMRPLLAAEDVYALGFVDCVLFILSLSLIALVVRKLFCRH
jgi:hypothetical protein